MLVVTDPRVIADADLRDLLQLRFDQVCDGEDYDPDIHSQFFLVEPGDSAEDVEVASSCPVFHNLFDQASFGDPDFAPSWEVLEEHPCCYEMVFIFSDGDAGTVIFIPKSEGIDPELLKLCAHYAVLSL